MTGRYVRDNDGQWVYVDEHIGRVVAAVAAAIVVASAAVGFAVARAVLR